MFLPFLAAVVLANPSTAQPIQAAKAIVTLSLMPSEPLNEENYLRAVRDEIKLGVQGTYVNVKWTDLENDQPFNAKAIQDQLGIAKLLGGDVVVCIKPVDTSVKTVPIAYMTRPFDDPEVLKRWEEMLQNVIPLLPKNTKAIALGNEVDVYFNNHPNELPSYMNLVKSARTFLRGAGLKIPVGVITTYDGLQRHPDLVKQIQSNFDITMMTYYPLTQNFEVLPMNQVGSHFDAMVALAGSKPLFLTEIGCPAGEANKSSEDIQAQFVTNAFDQLRQKGSKVAFANFFIQGDFPDSVLDVLENYYQLKDESFRSYLGTLGLRKSNGTPRKSYAEFKKQLRAWTGD